MADAGGEMEVLVQNLQMMGFSAELSQAAALLCGSTDVERALDLIETTPAEALIAQAKFNLAGADNDEDEDDDGPEYKAVFVVRKDLQMSPGKVAAQVAHAVLALVHRNPAQNQQQVQAWQITGEKIVVCECADEQAFAELKRKAQECNVLYASCVDAGRTEVAPESETVVGFGPAPEEIVNQVTGRLALLK
ncbi:unnamed protein product [Amoebophrya sp. A120]|nr:unnamed protein product [Amoebophrya sp. A120]|eukprot:GSA120T00002947001.1